MNWNLKCIRQRIGPGPRAWQLKVDITPGINYGMGFEVTKVWINVCFYSNWDYSFKVFKWKYECTENADENSNNQFHLNLAWIQYLLTLIPLLHAISPSIYIIIMICFYFCTLSGLPSQHLNIINITLFI